MDRIAWLPLLLSTASMAAANSLFRQTPLLNGLTPCIAENVKVKGGK